MHVNFNYYYLYCRKRRSFRKNDILLRVLLYIFSYRYRHDTYLLCMTRTYHEICRSLS